MATGKTVLTTGEVAKICKVAPRTVSKWFDSGQLRGYRIPGSKDRRIPVEHLLRFMRSHGMPLNGLDAGHKRLVILDADPGLGDALRRALAGNGGYEVATASSAIEAGAVVSEQKPDVFIVDVTLPDVAPRAIARWLRSAEELRGTCLVGVAPGLTEGKGQALVQDGFDAYLSKPFDVRTLVQLIESRNSDSQALGPA
jgi:excisionase family DNA binding protein